MKFFGIFISVMVALALLVSGITAKPKGVGSAIVKGGKVIKHGFGVISAIGTGHEVYEHVRNRH
nr:moricin-like peptide 5 [Antheraea pernyi]